MYSNLKRDIAEYLKARLQPTSSIPYPDRTADIYLALIDKLLVEPKAFENDEYQLTVTLSPYKTRFTLNAGERSAVIRDGALWDAQVQVLMKSDNVKYIVDTTFEGDPSKISFEDVLGSINISREIPYRRAYSSSPRARTGAIYEKVGFGWYAHDLDGYVNDLSYMGQEDFQGSEVGFLHVEGITLVRQASALVEAGLFGVDDVGQFHSLVDDHLALISERVRNANLSWLTDDVIDAEQLESMALTDREINLTRNAPTEQARAYVKEYYNICSEIDQLSRRGINGVTMFNLDKEIWAATKHSEVKETLDAIYKGRLPYEKIIESFLPEGRKPNRKILSRIAELHSVFPFGLEKNDERSIMGSIACSEILEHESVMEWLTAGDDETQYTSQLRCRSIVKDLRNDIHEIRAGANAKSIKARWNWLTKSNHNYAENFENLDEKYRLETMRDVSRIVGLWLTTVTDRIVAEYARQYDLEESIFSIDDFEVSTNHGDLDCVAEEKFALYEEELVDECCEVDDYGHPIFSDEHDTLSPTDFEITPIDEYIISDVLNSKERFKDRAARSHLIHTQFTKINSLLGSYHDPSEDVTWTALVAEEPEYYGCKIKSVTSRTELRSLGEDLRHCAYTYLKRCMGGVSFIYSVDNGSGLSSSFEVQWDDKQNQYEVQQHYGYKNRSIDKDSAEQMAVDQFVENLNNGVYEVAERISVTNEDLINNVESGEDIFRTAAILSTYNFDSDAAFICYSLAIEHMGKEKLSTLLQDNNYIDEDLPFFMGLKEIEHYSEKLKVSPIQFLASKMELELDDFKSAFKQLRSTQDLELTV
ncbi:hypothetical protein AB4254_08560 [Vibrio breoganii]